MKCKRRVIADSVPEGDGAMSEMHTKWKAINEILYLKMEGVAMSAESCLGYKNHTKFTSFPAQKENWS